MLLPRGIIFALCLLISSVGLAQEDEEEIRKYVVAPAGLQQFIAEGIDLLEAEDYQKAIDRFISPIEKHHFQQANRWEQVQRGFGEEKAEQLLKALREAKNSRTLLSHQDTVATYEIPKSLRTANSQLSFQLVKGNWYILNNRPEKAPETTKD